MKTASRVMYRIANFFLWILVLLALAMIVIAILEMTNVMKVPEGTTGGVPLLIAGIVVFLLEFIVLASSRAAARNTLEGNHRAGPHVWMLILGLISGNAFFVLGAIFGLIGLRH